MHFRSAQTPFTTSQTRHKFSLQALVLRAFCHRRMQVSESFRLIGLILCRKGGYIGLKMQSALESWWRSIKCTRKLPLILNNKLHFGWKLTYTITVMRVWLWAKSPSCKAPKKNNLQTYFFLLTKGCYCNEWSDLSKHKLKQSLWVFRTSAQKQILPKCESTGGLKSQPAEQ